MGRGQVGARQGNQEFVTTVAKHLVLCAQVQVEVADDARQHGIAHRMAVLVIDPFQVVDVHEDDAAGQSPVPRQQLQLMQRRQHLDASVGARECIPIADGCIDGVAQRINLQPQARAGRDEVLEIDAIDRRTVPSRTQQFRRNLVQTLVLLAHRGKGLLPAKSIRCVAIEPVPERTRAMRRRREIIGVDRVLAEDGAQQVLVPARVLVGDFPQLLSRKVQCGRIHPFHGCAP